MSKTKQTDMLLDASQPETHGEISLQSAMKPRQPDAFPDNLSGNPKPLQTATVSSQSERKPPNVVTMSPPIAPEPEDFVERVVAALRGPEPEDPDADFNWGTDDAIVVREQPATAVYVNRSDGVVIRQERTWDRDEDTFVFIRPENVITVVRRMLACAGHGNIELVRRVGGGYEDVA